MEPVKPEGKAEIKAEARAQSAHVVASSPGSAVPEQASLAGD
jgi:hypothetical protein